MCQEEFDSKFICLMKSFREVKKKKKKKTHVI